MTRCNRNITGALRGVAATMIGIAALAAPVRAQDGSLFGAAPERSARAGLAGVYEASDERISVRLTLNQDGRGKLSGTFQMNATSLPIEGRMTGASTAAGTIAANGRSIAFQVRSVPDGVSLTLELDAEPTVIALRRVKKTAESRPGADRRLVGAWNFGTAPDGTPLALTLKADGSFEIAGNSRKTIEVDGTEVPVEVNQVVAQGRWSATGNKLTLVAGEQTVEFTYQLRDGKLVLSNAQGSSALDRVAP